MTSLITGFTLLESEVSLQRASLRARLPAGSPYFVGHFPSEPILPAIAQLALALHAARLLAGEDLVLAGLRGVRLRRALRPGDECELAVTRTDAADEIHFELIGTDGVAASGTLVLGRAAGSHD